MTPDELSDRVLEFAARIGKIVDALPDTRLGRHAAGQLVRCGTSSGPNYEEACAGESRADFVHKMKIVLKEMRETRFWLRLIVKAEMQPANKMTKVLDECVVQNLRRIGCHRERNQAKEMTPAHEQDPLRQLIIANC